MTEVFRVGPAIDVSPYFGVSIGLDVNTHTDEAGIAATVAGLVPGAVIAAASDLAVVATVAAAAVDAALVSASVAPAEEDDADEFFVRFDDGSKFLRADESRGLFDTLIEGQEPLLLPDPWVAGVATRDPSTGVARILWGVRDDGTQYPELADDSTPAPGPDVSVSGDSLTAGTGGTPYPTPLAALLLARGYAGVVRNLGVGGESSRTIAGRAGARPMMVMFPGGTGIPASGGVTVTIGSDTPGGGAGPLIQGSAGLNPVTILGVAGTLSYAASVYTFTRAVPGSAVPVSATWAVPMFSDSWASRRDDIQVMWWGQNDAITSADTDLMDNLIGRYRSQVEHQHSGEKRYLVLGLPTDTAANRAVIELKMLNAFGRRFINVRQYLSSPQALIDAGITATANDLANQATGTTQDSLRSDSVHLNTAGYALVAQLVFARMIEMGWI